MTTRFQVPASALGLLVGLLLFPGSPNAHPHIFVTTATTIVWQASAITALEIVWTFDEMYSMAQTQEADTNNDGKTTDAELAALAQQTIDELKELNYYTSARLGEHKLTFAAPVNYGFERKDDILAFRFTLPFEPPISLDAEVFSFVIRDPEFASAFIRASGEAIKIRGIEPVGCELTSTLPASEAAEIQRQGALFPLGGPDFGLSVAVVGSVRCLKP